mgnify:CR=1 FL=1
MAKAQKFFYVKQLKSGIARTQRQKDTLRGLGLGKINKVVKLADTPAARGMQQAVHHLTVVVDASQFAETK